MIGVKSKRFTVSLPKNFSRMVNLFCLFVILIPVIGMLVRRTWNPVLLVCVFLLDLPFVISAIWIANFRTVVDGDLITVRRGCGTKYTFEIKDIQKVKRRINHTRMGTSGKFTIYAKRHKVSVEPMMINYKQMEEHIFERVSAEKVTTKEITLSMPTK